MPQGAAYVGLTSFLVPYAGNEQITKGDLCYLDNSGNVHTATTWPGLGSAQADQEAFAKVFVGVAGGGTTSTSAAGTLLIVPNWFGYYESATSPTPTPATGVQVTVSENAGVTGLLNQITTTTDPHCAIGTVILSPDAMPPYSSSGAGATGPYIQCLLSSNLVRTSGFSLPGVTSNFLPYNGTLAASGTTLASAAVLPSDGSVLVTGANGTLSVGIPAAGLGIGESIFVFNQANNVLPVFPPVGSNFAGGTANAAHNISNASGALVIQVSSTVYLTNP